METEVERNTPGENGDSNSGCSSTGRRSDSAHCQDESDGVAGMPGGEGESPGETAKGTEKSETEAQSAPDQPVVELDSLIGLALENLEGD